ncbi:MAG: patatin-like phospholipase family protein [Polyangiaceae bacterium]
MPPTRPPPATLPPPSTTGERRGRVAVILSGGGARGAYEVGVLSYLFDHFERVRKRPIPVDFILGTSVGAINGCFLASHLNDPGLGVRRLSNLWSEIHMDEVLGFGFSQLSSLPRLLVGGGRDAVGLFDVSPMARLVEREIAWRAISKSFRDRRLLGLSVSATEISTGKTVLFMQTAPGVPLPPVAPARTEIRAARIGPIHALASAAIPIIFPAVRIGQHLYMDGGVRQNTPIAPALRLGATHVFAVGLSRELRDLPTDRAEKPPNVAFVIGKVLNAFLLDHITSDFEILDRVNTMIDQGVRAFGPDFMERVNAAASSNHAPEFRRVKTLVVRPSEDIGRIAESYVRSSRVRAGAAMRRVLSLLDVGEASEADLASYMLFDGAFARRLIELGWSDAEAQRDSLRDFFEDAEAAL